MGGGTAVDDRLEQRPQVLARRIHRHRRRPGAGAGVEDREVELLFGRVEVDEQVEDLVEHFLDPRVGTIDLVDDDDRRQPAFERLAQHEPGLRQRPFRGVDQQQDAVDHRQHALDLTAEVGVARGVDDVDEQVLVVDRGVLGQDGDAAFPFEVGIVHRPLGDPLVRAERAALVEQRIHQRRLAMVDVGDDGDVAPERIGDCRGGLCVRGHLYSVPAMLTPRQARWLRVYLMQMLK